MACSAEKRLQVELKSMQRERERLAARVSEATAAAAAAASAAAALAAAGAPQPARAAAAAAAAAAASALASTVAASRVPWARPLETDILVFHYVLEGPEGTPYAGGYYHGLIKFPSEYPLKPPSVLMLTPSGRFEVNQRICLSMSDYHPETWQPTWSHDKILIGLLSFMTSNEGGVGSVQSSDDAKRRCAQDSLGHNVRTSKEFCKLFPELVERHRAEVAAAAAAAGGEGGSAAGAAAAAAAASGQGSAADSAGAATSATTYLLVMGLGLFVLFLAIRYFGSSSSEVLNDEF